MNRADSTNRASTSALNQQAIVPLATVIHQTWKAMKQQGCTHQLGLLATRLLYLRVCLWAGCSIIAQRLAPPHLKPSLPTHEIELRAEARRLGLAVQVAKELVRYGRNLQTAQRAHRKHAATGRMTVSGPITWDAPLLPNNVLGEAVAKPGNGNALDQAT